MLLARLGVGFLGLMDKDTIDVTNLNRVHGSRTADVDAGLAKVDILAREIRAAGLGTQVVTKEEWVGHPDLRDLLRSCDVLFGCTDDHQGRLTLNRLAHYYGIPLIDVGLRMRAARSGADFDMTGRVSTIGPGKPCLMCLGVADPRRAAPKDSGAATRPSSSGVRRKPMWTAAATRRLRWSRSLRPSPARPSMNSFRD